MVPNLLYAYVCSECEHLKATPHSVEKPRMVNFILPIQYITAAAIFTRNSSAKNPPFEPLDLGFPAQAHKLHYINRNLASFVIYKMLSEKSLTLPG